MLKIIFSYHYHKTIISGIQLRNANVKGLINYKGKINTNIDEYGLIAFSSYCTNSVKYLSIFYVKY